MKAISTGENRSCKYDGEMACFHIGECDFPSLPACLKHNLLLSHRENALLRERKNLKHDKISLKWRETSFYYKRKCKELEEWIRKKGLEVPKIGELFGSKEAKNGEVINDEARRHNSEG